MEPALAPAIEKSAKTTEPLHVPAAAWLEMISIYTERFGKPTLVPAGAGPAEATEAVWGRGDARQRLVKDTGTPFTKRV